jgi:hypothetical protein
VATPPSAPSSLGWTACAGARRFHHFGSGPYADFLCEERSDGTEHEQQRVVAFIAFSF